MTNRLCAILVGLPASGKSTFRNDLLALHASKAQEALPAWTAISSDDLIEYHAKQRGQTYSETFSSYAKEAEKTALGQLKYAADFGDVIVIDRTNMSKRSRSKMIDLVIQRDQSYDFVCFDFSCRTNDWDKRLKSRPGKEIPELILNRMMKMYEAPSLAEGFCHIEKINTSDPYQINKYYNLILNLIEGKPPHHYRG